MGSPPVPSELFLGVGRNPPRKGLPLWLRLPVFAPLVFFMTCCSGFVCSLPPGPLCDEGMVLFMEGGCDWGLSNEFFFSKLALLVAATVAFLAYDWRPESPWRAFVPHLAALVALMPVAINWEDPSCQTYYGHPQETMVQMLVEGVAFVGLGISLLAHLRARPFWNRAAVAVAWNATHVLVFYAWLPVTRYWTWLHTGLVAGTLGLMAAITAALPRMERLMSPPRSV